MYGKERNTIICLSHQVSQPEVSLFAEVIDSLEVDFTFYLICAFTESSSQSNSEFK